MTPEDRETLKTMVAANKQLMSLLDKKAGELQKLLSFADERAYFEDAKKYPYFYGAEGQDGEFGIPLSNGADADAGTADLYQGRIEIQENAPFVWTGVLAVMARVNNLTTKSLQPFRPVKPAINTDTTPSVDIGFVDGSSGRVLYQASTGQDNDISRREQPDPAMFNMHHVFDAQRTIFPGAVGTTVDVRPGCYAQGHGPNNVFELPAEMLLPASGVIRVDVRPSFQRTSREWRLWLALIGYNIFGD